MREPRAIQDVLCLYGVVADRALPTVATDAVVAIGIALHNQGQHVRAALESALAQRLTVGPCIVLLLDDASTDGWRAQVADLLDHPRLVVLTGRCGSAARARNALFDFVDEHLPRVRWVARLDADDELAGETVVDALVSAGEAGSAAYVIGSNHLVQNGKHLPPNIADARVLLDRDRLTAFIESFGLDGVGHELPSCNLLLRSRAGIRYPDTRSAEDHWLVAKLLMFQPENGVVVPAPVYARYNLFGNASRSNQRQGAWTSERRRLAMAVSMWREVLETNVDVLGVGQEGCVWREAGLIRKRYYPWAMDAAEQARLERLVQRCPARIPQGEWRLDAAGRYELSYPDRDLRPVPPRLGERQLLAFLEELLRAGLVTSNIKRENLRLNPRDELVYIDVGKDIVAYSPSRYLDCAAKLYAMGILGLPDGALARRQSDRKPEEALAALEGFADFYRRLIERTHPLCRPLQGPEAAPLVAPEVTLLIKACAQDAPVLREQVVHIVSQLSAPRRFARTILTIDPFPGPFLRQYAEGDPDALRVAAQDLRACGVIDELWVSPTDPERVRQTYARWFGTAEVLETHTSSGAPLFPQLWALDRIDTRYVLQCDVDVLVGREDLSHDYLAEMLQAAAAEKVWSVGFNIPKAQPGFRPYASGPAGFPPEIRLGLLDLARIRRQRPFSNPIEGRRFTRMWHRVLEEEQRRSGYRSVRGGDSRSFYLHPCNGDKPSLDWSRIRDLVSQAHVPAEQAEQWDLIVEAPWRYPRRSEDVVVLLKGRDTSEARLRRCFDSLHAQTDQAFGLIVIEDGGDPLATCKLPALLGDLRRRTTLIRRARPAGRIPNFREAITELCVQPEALIVVLDLDDALLSPEVIARLKRARNAGADLITGLMFRPQKPLKLYFAEFVGARERGGGNVWAHLRAFTKALFERVPADYLKMDGGWVDECTDYATMVPMSELATQPIQITDLYCYYHDRGNYDPERKERQAAIIKHLLCLPALTAEKLPE